MPNIIAALFLAAFTFVGTVAVTTGHDTDGHRRSFKDAVACLVRGF